MQERTERRGRKRSPAKDRVLQARIPEQLDNELRGRAEQLGMSVSTIVRNVLLHTFDLVEGVVTDSSQIARALSGRSLPQPTAHDALPPAASPTPSVPAADSLAAVIGWQEVVLNKNGVCEECNAILAMGERAAIGVPTGARAILLCMQCLGRRTATTAQPVKRQSPPVKKKKPSSVASAGRKKTTR